MAADSDGLVETVLTCEGDLSDPHFPQQFKKILANLRQLLFKGSTDGINLQKVEPWNSVRVTFTIPKEAAVRLRQLAQQGNATLLQLGILSVQVEGDEVISLRMANRFGGEAQEIVMHTGAPGPSTSSSLSSSSASLSLSSPEPNSEASNVIRSIAQSLSQLPGTSGSTSAFKSPNVVAPLDSDPIPMPPTSVPSSSAHYHGPPFPFASMTHAAHAIHSRETLIPPPPPYPGPSRSLDPKPLAHPANVALSSPLLVNLLQNDGFAPATASTAGKSSTHVKSKPAPVSKMEHVPNPAFVSTKLPEPTVHLANPSSSQIHIANANSSHVQIADPNPSQIHLANPNLAPNHLANPNPNPTSLAQPPKPPQSPFMTKQSVVNQALYSRQIHQSVSSQTPMLRTQLSYMQSHSQMSSSQIANSNSQPNTTIHPQPKPIEQQARFSPSPQIDPSPLLTKHPLSSSISLPPPPSPSLPPPPSPSIIPPSSNNNVRSDIQSPLERPPQNHQETMVEAKDFPPLPPPKLPSPPTPNQPSTPLPSPAAKTEEKTIGSEHNKTENVKLSETSQPSHTNSKKQPVMLINPLTGDLEPIPNDVESSDTEMEPTLPPLVNTLDDPFFNFSSPFNERSNSLFSDDDDVSSILNKKSESLETSEPENSRTISTESKNPQQQANEKIKLRLKLEKSEPVMPVYKADVSFVNTHAAVRKVRASGSAVNVSGILTMPNTSVVCSSTMISPLTGKLETETSSSSDVGVSVSTNPEEPKVPPLHISLRGRNAAVVVNSKDDKKWKEGFKAAVSSVKKANKATTGSGFKDSSNFVKKNLVFSMQPTVEENEEEEEEESEDEEEEEDDEDEEEDEEQDGEDTEDDDDEEDEDNKRDVDQNLKNRLEPGEIVSPYSTPIRTAYPTAEEVTSILRSMPSDTHHKMSLSFPKEVKKKESIKKQLHQRLVEGPLSLFHKNTKSKTKSSNSLLKSVVKRAKEARLLSAVRHNTDKQRAIGNGVQRKSSSDKETSPAAAPQGSGVISPGMGGQGASIRKFKFNRQTNSESSKSNVPLNHNASDVGKKIVNNVKVNCNMKNKDILISSLPSYSTVHSTIVNTVTNASTSSMSSFNKNFTSTNSQNKKMKDFHLLSEKDIASFDKAGLKSISSLLNNTLEPFTKLENSSVLLPIIHDIELTEKKIKQKMLESEKAQQLQQLQQEQMMSFSEADVKNITMNTALDTKLENTRNSTESIRQDNVRSSTENNVNQSEPGNSQGEDSGIESMDALSEKSPNQSSESPLYKNNEKDEKPPTQTINSHGVKLEKIGRTSSIETQTLPSQSVKPESVDVKSETPVQVKKEANEKSEDKTCDENSQSEKATNRDVEKLIEKDKTDVKDLKIENVDSPTLEDPQPIRITPALYTYSNSEKVREDTPSPNPLEEEDEEQSGSSTLTTRAKRKRKADGSITQSDRPQHDAQKSDLSEEHVKLRSPMSSKSLLEQLLIEIPNETRVEPRRSMTTRNTRSQNKFCDMSPEVATSASSTSSASSRTPHSSPSLSAEPPPPKTSPSPNNAKPRSERAKSKRNNNATSTSGTGGSNGGVMVCGASSGDVNSSDESNTVRPNKRKCSENAAELIKACMGVEDHFHSTGKKQHLDPGGVIPTPTPTPASLPPAKTPKKKGTDAGSDEEAPLGDILVKHKSCDITVKTPSSNNNSQPSEKGPPVSLPPTSSPIPISIGVTSSLPVSAGPVLASGSPLIRTSSRIESKSNRRSNRQNKASNDNSKKVGSANNNNKVGTCGLIKNNNCITRGASKATNATEETLASVRRKTRSANVHDSELGPGKRRRSSKDSK